MQQYNALESQKLFRQVEHGQFRQLPGGELIDRLCNQLRVADEIIMALDQELKSRPGAPRADLSPVYLETGRIIPSEGNPTGAGAPVTAVAPPPRQRFTGPLPAAAAGVPTAGGPSAFLGGARQEAPPPIPFNETPEGLEAAAENPPKRARRAKAK
jgi:hypothetical protein